MAVLLGTLISGAVPARQVTQPLSVSAKVLASAAFSFELGADSLVITDQDMKRGYVDVTMKSRVRYSRNASRNEARPSVTLDISGRPELFRSVVVAPHGNGNGNTNGNGNGNGNGHGPGAQQVTPEVAGHSAEFHYRFLLSDAGRAGSYTAPVSLIVEL